jgi:hypothetical protein
MNSHRANHLTKEETTATQGEAVNGTIAAPSQSWRLLAAGATVPVGMALAAAYTSSVADSEKVARTAWIAVAVVGAASVIAAAAAARHIFART